MKRALPVIAVALCALPAIGADPSPIEIHTLSQIDSVPTKDDIVRLTGPDAIPRLRELATSSSVDVGVRLRAIHALPSFCAPTCRVDPGDPLHPAHAAVLEVIGDVPAANRSGQELLLLRAGIESLGLARSGDPADVELLIPFLDDSSRDIRAATARALRDLCLEAAIVPLRSRYQTEQVAQVRLAISAALRDLNQCTP